MSSQSMILTAKILKPICLALAVLGAAAPALAEPGRETFTLELRYDARATAQSNYAAFQRQANRACQAPGVRSLDQKMRDRACVAETMDRLIAAIGRTELAVVHLNRTGRTIDSSRSLAAR